MNWIGERGRFLEFLTFDFVEEKEILGFWTPIRSLFLHFFVLEKVATEMGGSRGVGLEFIGSSSFTAGWTREKRVGP